MDGGSQANIFVASEAVQNKEHSHHKKKKKLIKVVKRPGNHPELSNSPPKRRPGPWNPEGEPVPPEEMIHLDGRTYDHIIREARRPSRLPPPPDSPDSEPPEEEQGEEEGEAEGMLYFHRGRCPRGDRKKKALFNEESMGWQPFERQGQDYMPGTFRVAMRREESDPQKKPRTSGPGTQEQQMLLFLRSKYGGQAGGN